MNFQYPEYKSSQDSCTTDCEECGHYTVPIPIQPNSSIICPVPMGPVPAPTGPHSYDNYSVPCMSSSSFYDNSPYSGHLDGTMYQQPQESMYCQVPTSESVACECNQAYWIPSPEQQYENCGSLCFFRDIPHPYTTIDQYPQQFSGPGNTTANNPTLPANFRPHFSNPHYSTVENIHEENPSHSHLSSTRSNQEFDSNSPTEPSSTNLYPKAKHAKFSAKTSNTASLFSHSDTHKVKAVEPSHKDSKKASGSHCPKRQRSACDSTRSFHANQIPSIFTQRSFTEMTQTSAEFTDVKARNMAYQLCKLFWTFTQSDWSKLCQKCFSVRNTEFDDFLMNSDILTQYITMLQSINLIVQAPNFLRDLDLMHQDEKLVGLVGTYFNCLARILALAITRGEFYYYSDALGSYGPKQDDDDEIIVFQEVPLETIMLDGPVNGMYAVLKKFRVVLMSVSRETREKYLSKFLVFMSNKLINARDDFRKYNELMGETFELKYSCKAGSLQKKASILKKPDARSQKSKRVSFGQAELRDIQVKDFDDEDGDDLVIDQVFDTPEALKHQRAIRRLLLEDCMIRGEDVEITPRERYSGKREIVEKLKFVKEITDNFDNPRTVLRLSPPDSPDSQKSLPFDNVSNSHQQMMPKKKSRKRKKKEDGICENVVEIKRRRK